MPTEFPTMKNSPGQLFYSTQIPLCLWFLTKNKNADAQRGCRDRRRPTNAGRSKA